MTDPRLLAIIGSGETGPSITPVHRDLLRRGGVRRAVLLDSSFGFQANADSLTDKIRRYFATSLQCTMEVATLRDASAASASERERMRRAVVDADLIFAGPGSPSYALRQWNRVGLGELLRGKLRAGGSVVFASAAAITLGECALPVYEIYKVGERPAWLPGLNVLQELGWRVAVVPHYDNAEGGGHDTRYCYMGERRLAELEAQLDPEVAILGIDEHTALVVDLVAGTAFVHGHGSVTVRRGGGDQVVVDAGDELDLALLGEARARRPDPGNAPTAAALGGREALLARLLDLDARVEAGDATAHTELRLTAVRLAEAAPGDGNPLERIRPLIQVIVAERDRARNERRWADADRLRDGLVSAGIEVRDTPHGAELVLDGETVPLG